MVHTHTFHRILYHAVMGIPHQFWGGWAPLSATVKANLPGINHTLLGQPYPVRSPHSEGFFYSFNVNYVLHSVGYYREVT